jgi:hypothetical protein
MDILEPYATMPASARRKPATMPSLRRDAAE